MSTLDHPGVVTRPPLLYLAAFLGFLVLRWLLPLRLAADGMPLVYAGVALALAGLGIGFWGRALMVAARTNLDPMKPATAIVTGGPFRFSRNPLYVGMTMLYVGLTLAFNTWWGFVLLVPLLAVMHFGVILREEVYLEAKFGDEYRRYKGLVARYVWPVGA